MNRRSIALFVKLTALHWGLISSLIIHSACSGKGVDKPIVDVRFDAPFRQIENSVGDEWAPTWARDDVLYTGSDDGTNFGGIPPSAVAVGKLEGNDPYHLMGTTINRMKDYREGQLWRTTNRRVPAGPGFREISFISLPESYEEDQEDPFHAPAGAYGYAVAEAGVVDGEDQYFVAKARTSTLAKSNPAAWGFLDKNGMWTANRDAAFPMPNARFTNGAGINWKITNSYSVDGTLYMCIARVQDYSHSKDPQGRLVFRNSSIVKSVDGGKTWAREAQKNRDEPMFPGQRFGAPYFVWYGKDGSAEVDNANQYVYAVSNNGYWESGDHYVLGRVPRAKLAHLSAADWSFYRSGDGMEDASWSPKLSEARAILSDPGQASMTGMTYIEGLRQYVMIAWHYPSHGVRDVAKNKDAHTILEFFEAPHPWGPWVRFKTFKTDGLSWYAPIVGQRFQRSISHSAVSAFIYVSSLDFANKDNYLKNYKLNYIPITFSTAPLKSNDQKFIGPPPTTHLNEEEAKAHD